MELVRTGSSLSLSSHNELFQVMDNVTGQRLPFVACYACKVLYTDTGGGTGNMTRHRCPLGASYRSIAGSSTDTINDSFNAQSSFESYHGQSPENGKISIYFTVVVVS